MTFTEGTDEWAARLALADFNEGRDDCSRCRDNTLGILGSLAHSSFVTL